MQTKVNDKFVHNPLITPVNQDWSLKRTASLARSISPPPVKRQNSDTSKTSTALVEAGKKHIEDHLAFFSQKLRSAAIPSHGSPCIHHSIWVDLYNRNLNQAGHHFVVHQHDHPVAGTHYDLRLQCNATSSISFAIMYGLPGDPNSRRLNRNATETRVHNLWSHLIETASHQTGTMLIWDTGEYEVLPYREPREEFIPTDDSSQSASTSPDDTIPVALTEQRKLRMAFQERKIRLRLHGTRLPKGYTISLRLTTDNIRLQQPQTPKKRRRKGIHGTGRETRRQKVYQTESSGSSDEAITQPTSLLKKRSLSSLQRHASPPAMPAKISSMLEQGVSSDTDSTESAHPWSEPMPKTSLENTYNLDTLNEIQTTSENDELATALNNAYPGATNDVSSIHQRRWYLSLDRKNSGFVRTQVTNKMKYGQTSESKWIAGGLCKDHKHQSPQQTGNIPAGFTPFQVLGRDHERSIVTGRLARDILVDEGVEGFIPRGMWRPVVE